MSQWYAKQSVHSKIYSQMLKLTSKIKRRTSNSRCITSLQRLRKPHYSLSKIPLALSPIYIQPHKFFWDQTVRQKAPRCFINKCLTKHTQAPRIQTCLSYIICSNNSKRKKKRTKKSPSARYRSSSSYLVHSGSSSCMTIQKPPLPNVANPITAAAAHNYVFHWLWKTYKFCRVHK